MKKRFHSYTEGMHVTSLNKDSIIRPEKSREKSDAVLIRKLFFMREGDKRSLAYILFKLSPTSPTESSHAVNFHSIQTPYVKFFQNSYVSQGLSVLVREKVKCFKHKGNKFF